MGGNHVGQYSSRSDLQVMSSRGIIVIHNHYGRNLFVVNYYMQINCTVHMGVSAPVHVFGRYIFDPFHGDSIKKREAV